LKKTKPFQDLVQKMLDYGLASTEELSKEFSVPKESIEYWYAGKAEPGEELQRQIERYALQKIDELF
jgi:hypothetical protein